MVDTNSHYVLNLKNSSVARKSGRIEIGAFNWVGNRTTFSKGANTKDGTIVCANSTVNKDFTAVEEENQMIGGTPAKLITSGLKRIFSTQVDTQIDKFFSENEGINKYTFKESFVDNYDDIKFWFKEVM